MGSVRSTNLQREINMAAKVYWLFAFVALYWAYCIFWGIRGARLAKTASDYFVAGRQISMWVFVLAATATSFSGWTFMGHPGLIFRDGFQYAYASFYTITIPFTGVLFLKRQWMLGKRFGYVTPGEMLSDYFQGDGIRILTVIVALLFSIPYLGVQLGASGFLFSVLSDGFVGKDLGMWILSFVVLIYVASGGLRAVAYVDTMQCILLALGIVVTGIIALDAVGGWSALQDGLAAIGKTDVGRWGVTEEGYNAYLAIPGVIQYTAGLGQHDYAATGGLWTGVMILTYMFGMMGVQAAPAFTMWAFSNNDPKPFAPQQVWASAFGIGLILFLFTAVQGIGAHLLGANEAVNGAGLALSQALNQPLGDIDPAVILGRTLAEGEAIATTGQIIATNPDSLIPFYFNILGDNYPWLIGILAVCALAAMQSTGAAYMSTAGGMLTRDLYKRYLNPTASHTTQKLFGRLGVLFIVLLGPDGGDRLGGCLGVAWRSGRGLRLPDVAVACGGLLVPLDHPAGCDLGPDRPGLIAVMMTEKTSASQMLSAGSGSTLPWGRWPLDHPFGGLGHACFNLDLLPAGFRP